MIRKIIKIDENKCTGCGLCVPDCAEGALQIIDGKARLISDLFCDGLGACIGSCPEGAIEVIEREAEPYDEKKVMEMNIIPAGENTIKAHLLHLKNHGAEEFLTEALEFLFEKGLTNPLEKIGQGHEKIQPVSHECGCAGSNPVELKRPLGIFQRPVSDHGHEGSSPQSRLAHWPVQINLLSQNTPFLKNSDLVVIADCVAYAYADTHNEYIKGRAVAIGCPKLDDSNAYIEKFAAIFRTAKPRRVTVVRMEVPCCGGITEIIKQAMKMSGEIIPFTVDVISIKGDKLKAGSKNYVFSTEP